MTLGPTPPLNRNEYQESYLGIKGERRPRKADNLAVIREPIL
jgi:hypothetical protein